MNSPSFFDVVPKPMRIWALIALGCVTVCGIAAGYHEGLDGLPFGRSIRFPHSNTAIGLFGGLLLGFFVATWLLCLGYVFADARRRAMPAIPWTLAAMLVPNLLGFLLYFVFRKPVAQPCAYCGQPVTVEQRFCPSCGQPGPAVPLNRVPPGPSTSSFPPPAIT